MDERPLISVIVPVYKVEPYLRKCLDSIVNQTYRNLEIILVDDGSPDNCGAICDEYAAHDVRIKVIHTENKGAYAARNTALEQATGEYISFVDADDWLAPNMLRRLLVLLNSQPNIDVAQCELVNDGAYRQIRNQTLGRDKIYESSEMAAAFFKDEITHGLIGKLFRTSSWKGIYFDGRFYHEDAMVMSKLGSFCERLIRTDEKLYYYNTRNESITRGTKTLKHIRSSEALFKCFSRAADKAPDIGSFYICREIPSRGQLILPGREVTVGQAVAHIRMMHGTFKYHWQTARDTAEFRGSPAPKRWLWHIYYQAPLLASMLMSVYGAAKRTSHR